jgi:hypothetical protein
MWENLTPADLDRARHELALEHGAMLSRHRAELKELDARYDKIEPADWSVYRQIPETEYANRTSE